MGDLLGKMFICDGEVKPILEWKNQISEGTSIIYEVIRVAEGVPLFFDDYYERLKNSFLLINQPFIYSYDYLKKIIVSLLEINGIIDGPVKLLFQNAEPKHFIAHLMVPHVPAEGEYKIGVHTILLQKERLNPNAKVWNQKNRNQTIIEVNKAKAYEGLLVNEDGFITEGSRSNVFFIKDDVVYTSPDDLILPGITRKKVLLLCKLNGIEVKLKKIKSDEISIYDSVFLTGTSRKVLPVKTIDNINFSVKNDAMSKIITEFEKLVMNYINEFRINS